MAPSSCAQDHQAHEVHANRVRFAVLRPLSGKVAGEERLLWRDESRDALSRVVNAFALCFSLRFRAHFYGTNPFCFTFALSRNFHTGQARYVEWLP